MSDTSSSLQFHCLGLNYRTSPVAVRERFAVTKARLGHAVEQLRELPAVEECVLLSTCNRTEIYYWTADEDGAREAIWNHTLGECCDAAVLKSCFYTYSGERALEHLAGVAAGLDSMVVGETEIFGQLKDAYHVALQTGSTGGYANRTFQHVFSIGKKVRSSTGITSGPTSVGAAAVQLAMRSLGNLSGSNVLIVGAGEVARTTAKSLKSRGAESIFVANRSYERAVELASDVGGKVIRFSEWLPYLENIDIVIVSTSAPVYVVSAPFLEQVQQHRRRPLFLIDLSVPRNIDPACAHVQDVHLSDMDTLQKMTEETRMSRSAQLDNCRALIREWIDEYAEILLKKRAYLPENALKSSVEA